MMEPPWAWIRLPFVSSQTWPGRILLYFINVPPSYKLILTIQNIRKMIFISEHLND